MGIRHAHDGAPRACVIGENSAGDLCVALGAQFGNWRVCWLGGRAKHRMFYLALVVRKKP